MRNFVQLDSFFIFIDFIINFVNKLLKLELKSLLKLKIKSILYVIYQQSVGFKFNKYLYFSSIFN